MANAQVTYPNIDVYIQGKLSAQSMTLPAGSVLDTNVAAYNGAGNGISAAKIQQQYQKEYGQPVANAAITEAKVIHVVRGATYTLIEFMAWASVPATGNDTCTFDLKQNGVSRLTSVITLDNTTAAYVLKNSAGFSAYTPAAGDIWEVFVTAVHNTGVLAKGVGCKLVLREDPQ